MALRVNLYHEVLRAKRRERYDPLKLSFIGLIVVGAMMLVYYGFQLKRSSDARSAFEAQKAEFDRLSPLVKAATEKEAELTKQITQAERLTGRMEKRFYWAPVLESILAAVPPNVQLTKLSCDTGREKGGICQVNMEGIAVGEEPRAAAEEMRKAIGDRIGASYTGVSATFRNLDDNTERVKVNGKPMASVIFTINVAFKPQPEPVPVQKRIAQSR